MSKSTRGKHGSIVATTGRSNPPSCLACNAPAWTPGVHTRKVFDAHPPPPPSEGLEYRLPAH